MPAWDQLTDMQRHEVRSLWIAEDTRRDSWGVVFLAECDNEIKTWWEGLSQAERDELYPLPSESPMHKITRELQEASS